MARETKAQRLEREAAERQAREEQLAAEYPHNLMEMLKRATNNNYILSVRDGKFFLDDRDGHIVELTLDYNSDSQHVLNGLDWRMDIQEAAYREECRKNLVKHNALLKLTQEECELLGIKNF